jgi:hypothetical protein
VTLRSLNGPAGNQAGNQAMDTMPRPFRPVNATGQVKAQSLTEVVASPHCDFLDTNLQRTAEECGRSTARGAQNGEAGPANIFRRQPDPAKIAAPSAIHRALFWVPRR